MSEEQPESSASSALAFPLVLFGVIGVIALVVALVVGMGNDKTTVSTSAATAVSLSDSPFSISPAVISATTGGGLDVTNDGTMQHNLAVEGTSLATAMLDPGATAHLDLSSLSAGTYTVFCQIQGHREAGMHAELHVSAGGGGGETAAAGGGGSSSSSQLSVDQMDQMMKDSITPFLSQPPATTTFMEPTILPDGTKQFELTAAETDWEVSPGKTVKAFTYNGTVPGPTIKVDVGDKVAVVLHNNLPESTSIHFHGITTPNSMDGTTFVTQDPVKPGETFTYSFTAQGPAVGMYHSHHFAVTQVPDGLAGAFLIGDEPVPSGANVSQHQIMMLDDSGVIGYAINGKSFPATNPIVAKIGDWVEIEYLNEGTQIHPMHLHGMPQLVIAKDGYPLANPSEEDVVTVAPGERYTVLVHATEPGAWVWHCHILPHAENDQGMIGMVTALIVQ